MSHDPHTPRAVDHVVLPVIDIADARVRYEALGFVVAPDGKHPFGTENCCVFLSDRTFLEPLGIAHRETCERAMEKGNTFITNDQAYRFRRGLEGFSHLVIKTDDAKADHKAFRKRVMSAGKMVRFSRKAATPDGQSGKARFALAFARDTRAPDAHFFSCQIVEAPDIDRAPLIAHANGATGIHEILMAEPNPSDFQYFLQSFLNQRHMDNHSFGIELETGNARVTVLSPDGMRAFYGADSERQERGLRFAGVVLSVANLDQTAACLSANGVTFERRGPKLIVPPSLGQGTIIAFQERS